MGRFTVFVYFKERFQAKMTKISHRSANAVQETLWLCSSLEIHIFSVFHIILEDKILQRRISVLLDPAFLMVAYVLLLQYL